jgi:hypothetical protein
MRSHALNLAFNRALIEPDYRQRLLSFLRATLLEAGVPEAEITQLEACAPHNLESLAEAMEQIHVQTTR